jgi:hypothetical protein
VSCVARAPLNKATLELPAEQRNNNLKAEEEDTALAQKFGFN